MVRLSANNSLNASTHMNPICKTKIGLFFVVWGFFSEASKAAWNAFYLKEKNQIRFSPENVSGFCLYVQRVRRLVEFIGNFKIPSQKTSTAEIILYFIFSP